MPRKNINFELDFMKKDIFPRFTVKQFDDVSFNIKPKNQGLDYDTTGMTGKIFVGVNNDMFMQTTGITVSSNNIKVLLDKNMLQNRGRAYAEIELTDSHGTITSSSFIFNIDGKIGEGAKIPGEYEGFVKKYERLISQFKTQVNSTIDNCNTNINSTINNCNKTVDNKLNDVDNFIDNKILDIEKRFNTLTSSQQQEAEVIDARGGEVSLKTRLDRDVEKVKQVYVELDGLQEKVSNIGSQLEHIVINIFSYLDDVVVVNGKEDWKPAFDKAFEDLQDGGTLLIPKHDYYISTRSTLENKKNIIINCAGKIMPIDGNIPLIGTITLNNLKDCVVNGLNMDGNIDNITYTNTYGTQSLLRMDNCSNIIFNNIKLENTCENGFSSNGNLNNIIFNNVEINGMGEHGFYFGGTNCNNIKFNNITCTDIGLNDSCSSRYCGVIKFRNKQLGDIMHDNIAIDGFNFISNQTDITGHRQLVCGYDVKNLTIKNGTIRGERTSIFSSNISLDNFIIDNVTLDGLQIFYGLNKGNDYSAELEQGRMYIAILNSDLYCSSNYNGSISLISNSKYKIKNVMDDKMSINGYIRDVVYDNVELDINENYFNISKIDRNYEFRNCIFKNKTNTSPLFNLASTSSDENCKFSLINCLETETHSISVQSNNKFDLSIINSTLKGEIKTLSSQLRNLIINNSNVLRGKIDTYAIADNFILNGIYDLNGKRYDMCVNNATCNSYNTFVNLNLKYEIARDIDLSKLIITNNKNIPFTVSNSENILTLSTIERQESDTVFSVFYTI